MITFFKNQADLAQALVKIIDSYWALETNEDELIKYLKQVYENNKEKVIVEDRFTTIIRQKLGKKRSELVSKILKIKGREE